VVFSWSRLVDFGINLLAGALFPPRGGLVCPFFERSAPLLRNKEFSTDFFKKKSSCNTSKKGSRQISNQPVLVPYTNTGQTSSIGMVCNTKNNQNCFRRLKDVSSSVHGYG
jgi:hypothetical protein